MASPSQTAADSNSGMGSKKCPELRASLRELFGDFSDGVKGMKKGMGCGVRATPATPAAATANQQRPEFPLPPPSQTSNGKTSSTTSTSASSASTRQLSKPSAKDMIQTMKGVATTPISKISDEPFVFPTSSQAKMGSKGLAMDLALSESSDSDEEEEKKAPPPPALKLPPKAGGVSAKPPPASQSKPPSLAVPAPKAPSPEWSLDHFLGDAPTAKSPPPPKEKKERSREQKKESSRSAKESKERSRERPSTSKETPKPRPVKEEPEEQKPRSRRDEFKSRKDLSPAAKVSLVRKETRLSPLLSPVRDLPVDANSLHCRIPLRLLKRAPPPPSASSSSSKTRPSTTTTTTTASSSAASTALAGIFRSSATAISSAPIPRRSQKAPPSRSPKRERSKSPPKPAAKSPSYARVEAPTAPRLKSPKREAKSPRRVSRSPRHDPSPRKEHRREERERERLKEKEKEKEKEKQKEKEKEAEEEQYRRERRRERKRRRGEEESVAAPAAPAKEPRLASSSPAQPAPSPSPPLAETKPCEVKPKRPPMAIVHPQEQGGEASATRRARLELEAASAMVGSGSGGGGGGEGSSGGSASGDWQAFVPTEAVRFEESELREAEWYLNKKATPIKREADARASNRLCRQLLYLEAVAYFLLSVHVMRRTPSASMARCHQMLADTHTMLEQVTRRFAHHAATLPSSLFVRIHAISLGAQALMSYSLYWARRAEIEAVAPLGLGKKEPSGKETPGSMASTPSPASSTQSSAASLSTAQEASLKAGFRDLLHLHTAHKEWAAAAEARAQGSPDDAAFFRHLDHLAEPLSLTHSKHTHLASYLVTAVRWLKDILVSSEAAP